MIQLPQDLTKKIEDLITQAGFIIFDFRILTCGRTKTLKILIDAPNGGIGLNECTQINRQLSELLEKEDFFKDRYIVEVSSPGVDWPLKERKDFQRVLSRLIHLYFKEQFAQKTELIGILEEVKDDSLILSVEGKSIEIKLNIISKAREEM
ncbi:MAG: ribosome maturation factor RimP [Candidatus Omnitrophota bacterium]